MRAVYCVVTGFITGVLGKLFRVCLLRATKRQSLYINTATAAMAEHWYNFGLHHICWSSISYLDYVTIL